VTGFYEPEADASPHRTATHRYPLLARPDDLEKVSEGTLPDVGAAFARRSASGLEPYWDRRAIESGALAGRGLEIAWLADKVDLFFIHVQGAARLQLPGGQILRVTYAAKNGHPFTGPGRVLADIGEIPAADVTMQSIRAWLRANPAQCDDILWRNRSYIFFKTAPVADPRLGPVAAAKVPLEPGRSIAVDKRLHTFGAPIFVNAEGLLAVDDAPFQRLMIAQDTGSAILGAARGDLFIGSGDAAGDVAGVIKHPADFHLLVPRGAEGAA
jgi:membrane-bound lytic murein transglycosylase A